MTPYIQNGGDYYHEHEGEPMEDNPAERTAVTHLWQHFPDPYKVTAAEAADWIMAGDSNQQAAFLYQMAYITKQWEPGQSWPMQCRGIAECLSDEQCRDIRNWLSPLIEHLESIPTERLAHRVADRVFGLVEEVVRD